MANNLLLFRAELLALLTTTVNLEAAVKVKLRNRMVVAFQPEWNARVASGTVDNAANRGAFLVEKWTGWLEDVYRAGSHAENTAAQAAPETL